MSTTRVISIGDLNVETGSGYLAILDQSYPQPETTITRVERDVDSPLVTKVSPGLHVYILQIVVDETGSPSADTVDARRRALMRALDTTRAPVTLTIENAAGTARRRYMNVVVRKTDQLVSAHGRGFVAQLEAADDVRWRSVTDVTTSWTLTADATHTLSVEGDLETYPVIEIEPQTDRAAPVWQYRRRFVIQWNSIYGGTHPIEVTGGGMDTAALLTAGKVTDESSMKVMLDGSEIPHAYGISFGSNSTTIWISPTFAPPGWCWLADDIGTWETTIAIEEGMRLRPSGTLQIDSEIITYSGRTDTRLYNVVRGAYDTTATGHNEHSGFVEVWAGYILYGPNAHAPTSSVDRSPIIDLPFSTNNVWRYVKTTGFYDGAARPGGWGYTQWQATTGAVHFTAASTVYGGYSDYGEPLPWRALGLLPGMAQLASFSNRFAVPVKTVQVKGRRMIGASPARYPGTARLYFIDDTFSRIVEVWNVGDGAALPPPNAEFDVSYTTPDAGTLAGSTYTRLRWATAGSNHVQADIQEMFVTFDPSAVPTVTTGDEETDYDLDMTITNQTTGEALTAAFPNMAPMKALVIDSRNQTVTYTGDGSNRYGVVSRNAPRPRFLRLEPGSNLLEFEEDGMGTVKVTVRYTPRWYA